MNREPAERAAFVRAHTKLARVPFVPEVCVFTATEVTPLWTATAKWLERREVAIPYWCVPWAGGQALARWVLDHPKAVAGKSVLDVGAGGGLVAIAAAKAGARSVRAVDVDPLACTAADLAARANGHAIAISCVDVAGTSAPEEVVLAGDVWYERESAERLARWLDGLTRRGAHVWTGDPGRSYVPTGLRELARYEVPTLEALEGTRSKSTRVLAFACGAF